METVQFDLGWLPQIRSCAFARSLMGTKAYPRLHRAEVGHNLGFHDNDVKAVTKAVTQGRDRHALKVLELAETWMTVRLGQCQVAPSHAVPPQLASNEVKL